MPTHSTFYRCKCVLCVNVVSLSFSKLYFTAPQRDFSKDDSIYFSLLLFRCFTDALTAHVDEDDKSRLARKVCVLYCEVFILIQMLVVDI